MDPLNAIAMLFEEKGNSTFFLGTCFAFRYRTSFLTAHHCVAGKEPEAVVVYHPMDAVYSRAKSVECHPTADLAVVRLASDGRDYVEPFLDFDDDRRLGNDFMAYGFPEDVTARGKSRPTARLFKGYFQRYMMYKSHLGYEYMGGELSVGCPGGLSGGPLFRPFGKHMLCGMVTENLEAATFLDSQEHVIENGKVVRADHYRRVINYGVGLMLHSVKSWLDQQCPYPNQLPI